MMVDCQPSQELMKGQDASISASGSRNRAVRSGGQRQGGREQALQPHRPAPNPRASGTSTHMELWVSD